MELVRFYAWGVKLGLVLALCGQLKSCTLTMMGMAAEKTERGIISYEKFSRMLKGSVYPRWDPIERGSPQKSPPICQKSLFTT